VPKICSPRRHSAGFPVEERSYNQRKSSPPPTPLSFTTATSKTTLPVDVEIRGSETTFLGFAYQPAAAAVGL